MSAVEYTRNEGKVKCCVGEEGLEPSPLARHGPKPCACTNSATRPSILKEYYVLLYFAYAPIAQLVEQLALNEKVPGPNPGGRTIKCREWESKAGDRRVEAGSRKFLARNYA